VLALAPMAELQQAGLNPFIEAQMSRVYFFNSLPSFSELKVLGECVHTNVKMTECLIL
jgi:hypothetical protein